MRRLMYLSVTIFCLSVSLLIGFHLGVRSAEADWDGSGFVVGMMGTGGNFLTSDGLGWSIQVGEWVRLPQLDPPVSPSQIKLWGGFNLVTTTDEVWTSPDGGTTWENMGPPPGGTSGVDVEPTTWGKLKNQYDN